MQNRTTRSLCGVKTVSTGNKRPVGRDHWNLKELRLVADDGLIHNPHHQGKQQLIDTISAIQKKRVFSSINLSSI